MCRAERRDEHLVIEPTYILYVMTFTYIVVLTRAPARPENMTVFRREKYCSEVLAVLSLGDGQFDIAIITNVI